MAKTNLPKLIYALQEYFENGEKKTRIVHVDEVDNGHDCNCICPNCKAELVARNNGPKNEHHFAHCNGADCKHGYESMLHMLAKDILSKANQITLPEYYFPYVNTNRGEWLVGEGEVFHYKSVELERSIETPNGKFIPDAILKNDGKSLAVEIFVTHKVNSEKADRIKQEQFSTIEIRISPREVWTLDKLRQVILVDVGQKIWIHKNGTNELADKLQKHSNLRIFSTKDNNYGEISDCPKKLWRKTQFKANISSCMLCEYCFGIENPNVYCAFNQACTCRKDFDRPYKGRRNKQIEELNNNDKWLIAQGKCPECSSFLKVKYRDDLVSVLCSNYSCKFLMKLNGYKVTYENRFGKEDSLPLPEFIRDDLRDRRRAIAMENYALEVWKEMGLCPNCNGELVLRKGSNGYFIGCSHFSWHRCKITFNPDWKNKTVLYKNRLTSSPRTNQPYRILIPGLDFQNKSPCKSHL